MIDVAASMEVDVPFYDVDVMQIVWHGHYVKYMELARCKLLDMLDYNYQQMQVSGYGWPVVDLRIKYIKPLKFRQKILIHAEIVEFEYGLKINFTITDKASGTKLTTAYTKQVAVNMKTNEMCLLSPEILKEKINAFHRR